MTGVGGVGGVGVCVVKHEGSRRECVCLENEVRVKHLKSNPNHCI
jgi:hypothetical protein